jgi:adenylate cyclase
LGYHLPIRYYGPAGSFRRLSAARLVRGDFDPAFLRGPVVVVGTTATGLGDTFATPFDRVAPGAEIFATAIGNLLSGEGLARTPSTRGIDAGITAGLPAAMIALMAMRRAAVGFAVAVLIFVLWTVGVFLAFVNGYWLGMAAPLATGAPLLIGYTGARFLVERQAGRRTAAEKAMLAKFHSPLLVDHLLREPEFLAKPIRQDGMQTLAERGVTANGGIVINYMGDGLLAAFGLPRPEADDAARTLVAVEHLHAAVSAWLAALPSPARDSLDFRIGAHFGPAIVSRLGSPSHQQITVSGDTVNVASRLLEVAKQQRCRIVVSEDLFAAATAVLPVSGVAALAFAPLTVPIRGRMAFLQIRARR